MKMTESKLWKIVSYYKVVDGVWKGKRGTFYFLSDGLTVEVKEKLARCSNVVLLHSRCGYAPEICHDVLFVF